ncbi:MAG: hypothetical protein ACK50M_16035 [Cyclobacteriaceae bacterium]|jgi:hypothetical protein
MTINYIDNVIELYCSDVEISDTEHGVQIVFNGENDLDYFLVQRHFDNDDYVSVFYTEGCNTSGHWTFILATLDKKSVTFSVDKMPIRIHLNITSLKDRELRKTLRNLMGLLGKLIELDK